MQMQSSKQGAVGAISLVLFILLAASALGDIVVFDAYKTTYTMEGDTLLVKKDLRIKNVGSSPIIPGEIHFKISKSEGDTTVPPPISNFNVINKYKKKLDSKQIRKDNEMDLVFTIWDPLLPKFFYDFTMEYEIEFEPKGLMFYEIVIPEEKTTIPIRSAETEFILPDKYHVTYAPEAEIEDGDEQLIRWESASNLKFEYSYIPMPKLGFPMVNFFWIFLILLLLGVFIFRVLRSRS